MSPRRPAALRPRAQASRNTDPRATVSRNTDPRTSCRRCQCDSIIFAAKPSGIVRNRVLKSIQNPTRGNGIMSTYVRGLANDCQHSAKPINIRNRGSFPHESEKLYTIFVTTRCGNFNPHKSLEFQNYTHCFFFVKR